MDTDPFANWDSTKNKSDLLQISWRTVILCVVLVVFTIWVITPDSSGTTPISGISTTVIAILALLTFGYLMLRVFAAEAENNKQRPILALISAGKYEDALNLAETNYSGSDTSALLLRGLVYIESSRFAAAERLYRQILANPSVNTAVKMQALLGLGQALIWQNRWQEAIDVFLQARVLVPTAPGPYNEAATICLRNNLGPERALKFTDKLLFRANSRINLGYRYHILANRAWALALLGDHEEAQAIVDDLLRLTGLDVPTSAKLHYYAGLVATASGNTQQAQRYFTKVLQSDPRGKYAMLAKDALRQPAIGQA